ncbi:TPA: hypothetical protein WIB07_002064, partial [Neisseria meningitidis]
MPSETVFRRHRIANNQASCGSTSTDHLILPSRFCCNTCAHKLTAR